MKMLAHAEDEDDLYLFELIIEELGDYGYDEPSAIVLMDAYYEIFTGSLYSKANDLTPLTMDFYRHQGYHCMANRIYFHIVLGKPPGEEKFVKWYNKIMKDRRGF